jgi:hypothetical protein
MSAGLAGLALAPALWLVVGPWDLSTVTADGHRVSEAAGTARIFAVLALVDAVAAVGAWRRWVTPVGLTVGAGGAWAILAFAVTAGARVSGANMAALWLLFGPAVVAVNSTVAIAAELIVRELRRPR